MAAHQRIARINQWMLVHVGLGAGGTQETTNIQVYLNNQTLNRILIKAS
jgi:hypothetical protein